MNPGKPLSGTHLVAADVVRGQETDAEVVFHFRIYLRKHRRDAIAYILHYRTVIACEAGLSDMTLMPHPCQQTSGDNAELSVSQSLAHRPLDHRILLDLRQQVHPFGNELHQRPLMAVNEQVDINPLRVKSVQQPDKSHFGTPEFQIVHQY